MKDDTTLENLGGKAVCMDRLLSCQHEEMDVNVVALKENEKLVSERKIGWRVLHKV